jgi:hypothetical protein
MLMALPMRARNFFYDGGAMLISEVVALKRDWTEGSRTKRFEKRIELSGHRQRKGFC